MYYVYILKLDDNKYYIGFSSSLRNRLAEHRKGRVFATRRNKSIMLVFYAAFKDKPKALNFERYLKSSSGFAFRNKRLI